MEYVSCDYCNNADYNIICSQKDIVHNTSDHFFQIVSCKVCGLNYTNPRPDKNEINNYYPKNYSFFNKKTFNFLKEKILIFFANNSLGLIFAIIPYINNKLKNYVKPKVKYPSKILKDEFFVDIGCGSGITAHFWGINESIKKYLTVTKNIYGIEPDIESQKILKSLGVTVFKNILDVPDNLKFDTIRLNWSLEHVHKPSLYFKFISKHLRHKDSKAIICIPNYSGHIYSIDKSNVELPIHLYHFKYKDILNYCKKFNLKIEIFKTFSYASMYHFSASINPNLNKYKNLSLFSLQQLQKKLQYIDKSNNGNDMFFIIKCNV